MQYHVWSHTLFRVVGVMKFQVKLVGKSDVKIRKTSTAGSLTVTFIRCTVLGHTPEMTRSYFSSLVHETGVRFLATVL